MTVTLVAIGTFYHASSLHISAFFTTPLSEALWHLLHNAIKFSPAGGFIGILADVEKDKVNFIVYDTGRGIPPEKQSVIWEAFVQLADPLKRGLEGLGLGLALVRSVAIAHGGSVMLRSIVGKGTAVGFSIPYRSHLTKTLNVKNVSHFSGQG